MATATWPDILVEAGFSSGGPGLPGGALILDDATNGKLDTATLGPGIVWTPLNGYIGDTQIVQSVAISRSSTRQLGPLVSYQAGTCTLTLANSDARFSPENLAGPYVSGGVTQVAPMVPVRVRVTWAGTTYTLFTGYVRSWTAPTAQNGPDYDYTVAEAQDGMCVLEGVTVPASGSVGAGELTGARISRILTAAGWYALAQGYSDIDAGRSAVQATTMGDTALSLLQLTADSEVGEVYVNGSGQLVFRDRYAPLLDTRSNTVQAVFGDVPYTGSGGNFLVSPDSDFEGASTGHWVVNGNCTIAASAAAAHGGTGSMSMTSSASGSMSAASCAGGSITTLGLPVAGGQSVTVSAWFLAASTARSAGAGAQFYTAGGGFISTATGTFVTDSASAWVQASASLTAPPNAAYCRAYVQVSSTGAGGEVHYVDDVSVASVTALPYVEITRPDDDTTMANDIQATVTGSGNMQEAKDTASIARFLFARSYARSDLILQGDADALSWAQYVLAISKNDEARFDSLTIQADSDAADLFPQVLGREIGDRIQVWRDPPGMSAFSKDCFISSISHDISVDGWVTVWGLRSAAKYGSVFTLDNATLGQLDSNSLAF